jgi:hypothetical protein
MMQREGMRTRWRSIWALVLAPGLIFGLPGLLAPAAHAAKCPPASVGGPTVGSVNVGDVSVPLKRVRYRNGGPLHPPASNRNAGISTVNAPIGSDEGTAVITWHIRYGRGCPGTLNDLATLPVGSTFSVRMKNQAAVEYAITERTVVRKGRYKAAWFRPDGPHRLALFTCGDFRNGVYQSTVVTLAEPSPMAIPQIPGS